MLSAFYTAAATNCSAKHFSLHFSNQPSSLSSTKLQPYLVNKRGSLITSSFHTEPNDLNPTPRYGETHTFRRDSTTHDIETHCDNAISGPSWLANITVLQKHPTAAKSRCLTCSLNILFRHSPPTTMSNPNPDLLSVDWHLLWHHFFLSWILSLTFRVCQSHDIAFYANILYSRQPNTWMHVSLGIHIDLRISRQSLYSRGSWRHVHQEKQLQLGQPMRRHHIASISKNTGTSLCAHENMLGIRERMDSVRRSYNSNYCLGRELYRLH